VELTVCPECSEPAEIQWRAVMESTDVPVEHAKVLCVRRHWFLLPTAALASPTAREATVRPVTARVAQVPARTASTAATSVAAR
jgi:hypothetical protein